MYASLKFKEFFKEDGYHYGKHKIIENQHNDIWGLGARVDETVVGGSACRVESMLEKTMLE